MTLNRSKNKRAGESYKTSKDKSGREVHTYASGKSVTLPKPKAKESVPAGPTEKDMLTTLVDATVDPAYAPEIASAEGEARQGTFHQQRIDEAFKNYDSHLQGLRAGLAEGEKNAQAQMAATAQMAFDQGAQRAGGAVGAQDASSQLLGQQPGQAADFAATQAASAGAQAGRFADARNTQTLLAKRADEGFADRQAIGERDSISLKNAAEDYVRGALAKKTEALGRRGVKKIETRFNILNEQQKNEIAAAGLTLDQSRFTLAQKVADAQIKNDAADNARQDRELVRKQAADEVRAGHYDRTDRVAEQKLKQGGTKSSLVIQGHTFTPAQQEAWRKAHDQLVSVKNKFGGLVQKNNADKKGTEEASKILRKQGVPQAFIDAARDIYVSRSRPGGKAKISATVMQELKTEFVHGYIPRGFQLLGG